MSVYSDRPGISGMYPQSTDVAELQRALRQQARGHEHAVRVSKVHWEEIKRLESMVARLAEQNDQLVRKVVVLEARMAIYAAVGAFAGGTIVAFVMKFAFN